MEGGSGPGTPLTPYVARQRFTYQVHLTALLTNRAKVRRKKARQTCRRRIWRRYRQRAVAEPVGEGSGSEAWQQRNVTCASSNIAGAYVAYAGREARLASQVPSSTIDPLNTEAGLALS